MSVAPRQRLLSVPGRLGTTVANPSWPHRWVVRADVRDPARLRAVECSGDADVRADDRSGSSLVHTPRDDLARAIQTAVPRPARGPVTLERSAPRTCLKCGAPFAGNNRRSSDGGSIRPRSVEGALYPGRPPG